MTNERRVPDDEAAENPPLDATLLSQVRDALDVEPTAISREMMWARIQQQRRRQATTPPVARPFHDSAVAVHPTRRGWGMRVAGIAALLVAGVGVGRYLLPATGPSQYDLAVQVMGERADSIAQLGFGPDAMAALPPSSDPARVAMEEHLARTVALLTTVRDEDPELGPGADLSRWARELLGTTRLLIDEPQLHDERTRRLLQDLELVLAQIIQVRGSAPETKRAPSETMRETNLLPRMRAAVTASRFGDETTLGGGL